MATRKGSSVRGRRAGATGGSAPLERLGDSIEAAQAALKELSGEVSKGTRDVLKDLDRTLRDARKNLRGARRTITKDLTEIQRAASGRPHKRASAARGTKARRSTATKAHTGSARKSMPRTSSRARKT